MLKKATSDSSDSTKYSWNGQTEEHTYVTPISYVPSWPQWTLKADAINYLLVDSRVLREFRPHIFSLPIDILTLDLDHIFEIFLGQFLSEKTPADSITFSTWRA